MGIANQNPDRLSRQQRQEFRQIRQNDGKQAARQYRRGILDRPPTASASIEPSPGVGVTTEKERKDAKREADRRKGIVNFDPGTARFGKARGVAKAVTGANQQHIQDQMQVQPNQFGPYGSSQYVINPQTGKPEIRTDLGSQQDLMDRRQNLDRGFLSTTEPLFNQMAQNAQQGLNFDNAFNPNMAAAMQDPNQMRRQYEDTMYNRFTRDYDQRFARQDEDFDQMMANKGIPVGSELYNRQKKELEQQQSDAYEDARARATQMGGDEMSRQFGVQQGQFGMGMQKRGQDINETQALYDQPWRTMGNTLGMYQGVVNPQFQQYQPIQVGNTAGMMGQIGGQQMGQNFAQNVTYPHQMAQTAAQIQGQLGAAGIAAEASKYGADISRQNAQTAADASKYGDSVAAQNNF